MSRLVPHKKLKGLLESLDKLSESHVLLRKRASGAVIDGSNFFIYVTVLAETNSVLRSNSSRLTGHLTPAPS